MSFFRNGVLAMKMVCKRCNADIESDKKIFSCGVCGEPYDLNMKSEKFDIKMLNGLKVSDLSYDAVKDGVGKGRYLSVDYITYQGAPWVKLKDSEFGMLLNISSADTKKTVDKRRNWFYLFIVSFIANIAMLVLIYFLTIR